MLQNGPNNSGLAARIDMGFMCVVMPVKAGENPTAADVAAFRPRRMPRAVIVMADPGLCGDFPRDPLQDVGDKRTPAADIEPAAADADYLEYLASMEAEQMQAAA